MKTNFLILLLISFLSTNAQKYPIQTMFKGDSVVILKYDQVTQVNKLLEERNQTISDLLQEIETDKVNFRSSLWKISSLKDTITNLKWKLNVTGADLTRKLTKANDTLAMKSQSLEEANVKIEFYKGEMERIKRFEWIEKRTRTQMKVGLGAVLVAWVALIITSK